MLSKYYLFVHKKARSYWNPFIMTRQTHYHGKGIFTYLKFMYSLLEQCVGECNEGARSQERMEEMVRLSKQLDFPPEVSSV